MVEERAQRRLAAILAADVVGYSRLIRLDEAGTLAALKTRRREVLEPLVAKHRGRIVKLIGDGALIEFASAVEAVECAVLLQRAMEAANAGLSEDRRIVLRIGINVGDVVVEDSDLYGDGVNIAARLEGIAEPGGICISRTVHDQIGNRLDVAFADLGERMLKNIAQPVHAYGVGPAGAPAASPVVSLPDATSPPEQPSIAVLAFDNMSGDAEQEYFSDGISEDIITDLSKIAGLMVIARNSSFSYKGKGRDIRTIGRELGVRAVLEGSIRRAGNRVRITAQLIDAATGAHLWAERYDRELTDIFAVQDEVTQRIVEALKLTLRPAEKRRGDGRTANVEAHDCFLQGRELLRSPRKDRAFFEQVTVLFERAIALDPDYVEPYAGLSLAYGLEYQNRWTDMPDALDRAAHFARQAIEKGPNEPYAHYVAGVVATWQRKLAEAKEAEEKALALNPNYALACGARGLVEMYLGDPRGAIPYFERAMRLDPIFTQQYLHFLGSAYLVAGDYVAAADTLRERIRLVPDTDLSRAFLAAALGHLGEFAKAQRIWHELKEVNPRYSFAEHLARLPFQNPADAERIREGLAKAALAS
jgi:adenylate cyclase